MLVGKVWGSTTAVIATPLFGAHRLEIKPNFECSLHKHQMKWNAFLVLEGELFIDVKKNDYDLVDTTRLGPGEMTTVAPGEFHKFRTGARACLAYEFYYLSPLAEDIQRKNCGGPLQPPPALTADLFDQTFR
jgi:mannose-6-phosphate isomerase-like protein (cupin superfamily)